MSVNEILLPEREIVGQDQCFLLFALLILPELNLDRPSIFEPSENPNSPFDPDFLLREQHFNLNIEVLFAGGVEVKAERVSQLIDISTRLLQLPHHSNILRIGLPRLIIIKLGNQSHEYFRLRHHLAKDKPIDAVDPHHKERILTHGFIDGLYSIGRKQCDFLIHPLQNISQLLCSLVELVSLLLILYRGGLEV